MVEQEREPLSVRRVAATDTHHLRLQILRPGQGPGEAIYPGDDEPSTRHWAAFAGETVVGVATLYAEPRRGGPAPGWRLRGMATVPAVRGLGAGRALLSACQAHVAAMGGGELWCNARVAAIGFYARHGLVVVSEEFEVPGIGAHVVMALQVAAGAAEG